MEAFADESVNEISAMCSAQSAKTLTILCLMAWAIAEDPGPILWVTASLHQENKSRAWFFGYAHAEISLRPVHKAGWQIRFRPAQSDRSL
jgi:Phage terminase large subunit (GpA)